MYNAQRTKSLLDELTIPHELALEFFVTFSRFEYALKKAGFVKGDENRVDPDWDKFGAKLKQLDTAAVLECYPYMRAHPAKKQKLKTASWTGNCPTEINLKLRIPYLTCEPFGIMFSMVESFQTGQ